MAFAESFTQYFADFGIPATLAGVAVTGMLDMETIDEGPGALTQRTSFLLQPTTAVVGWSRKLVRWVSAPGPSSMVSMSSMPVTATPASVAGMPKSAKYWVKDSAKAMAASDVLLFARHGDAGERRAGGDGAHVAQETADHLLRVDHHGLRVVG